ncbi:hypothetical protein SAMN02745857_00857 [Andreprevotia lacus DSM 23236]|jgi:hypothetical protein|uniref:Uncharacterized protein n=1 Tax=Andreprevotia lacus DSM 23236 TaxID=1121001 RepID=A0A1W1X8N7_9NEIS|nr:hypothetical protein [Andreprevotia lacus]SMC20194.1 hypothetical protein SAMN02745857_00857 [Andreprevotia lacus DSM 23236]
MALANRWRNPALFGAAAGAILTPALLVRAGLTLTWLRSGIAPGIVLICAIVGLMTICTTLFRLLFEALPEREE